MLNKLLEFIAFIISEKLLSPLKWLGRLLNNSYSFLTLERLLDWKTVFALCIPAGMLDIAVNVTYPEHGVIADKSIGIYMLLLLILHFIAYDRAYKNRKKQGS